MKRAVTSYQCIDCPLGHPAQIIDRIARINEVLGSFELIVVLITLPVIPA